jgi:hypothetical protein
MDKETEGKLDALFEDHRRRLEEKQQESRLRSEELSAKGAQLQDAIETIMVPILRSFAGYLEGKALKATIEEERRGSLRLSIEPGSSLHVVSRSEDMTFVLSTRIRGGSTEPHTTISLSELSKESFEDHVLRFVDAVLADQVEWP